MATNGSQKLTQLNAILSTTSDAFVYVAESDDGGSTYASKKIGIVQLVADILAKSDLGTFTGDTVTDNVTIAAAIQELETAIEVNDGNFTSVEGRVTTLENAGYATETYVDSAITAEETARDAAISTAIANLVASSPATLDTLNEIATALGNDPNLATTLTNLISGVDGRVDNLVTLSGVADGSTDLGSFTGSVISDNTDVKGALQELETHTESIEATVATNVNDIATNTSGIAWNFSIISQHSLDVGNLQSQQATNITDLTRHH